MVHEQPRNRGFLLPFLIASATVFLIGCGWTAWRWYRLHRAFFDTNLAASAAVAPAKPAPKKPIPSFMEGLKAPEACLASINPLFLPPYFNDGIQETLPDDIRHFARRAFPQTRREGTFETALLQRVSEALASFPIADLGRIDFNPDRPAPDYREVRGASRYWYLIGRILGEDGAHSEAVRVMLGVALLARITEPLSLTDMPMLRRMIACSIKKTAGRGLVALARLDLRLPRAEVGEILSHCSRLEQGLEFGDLFISEIRSLQELGQHMTRKAEAGDALALRKRPIADLLTDERRMERFFQTMVQPLIDATKRPFAVGNPEFQAHSNLLESKLSEVSTNRTERILRHLFSPEAYFFEELLYQTIPMSTKAFGVDIESRQFLRGGGIAVAVRAFRTETGRWPERLDEVASWAGRALPNDLFTDAPLTWETAPQPMLWSPGKDLKPRTDDDLLFIAPASEKRR